MKTRVVHTRFWQDELVSTLSTKEKAVFIYLLTNERVGLNGIYELPDKYMCVDLAMTLKELTNIKAKLQKTGKFFFWNSWIKIINHDKFNTFDKGKAGIAKVKEWELFPDEVKNTSIDTSIDTRMDTLNNHNHNHNPINNYLIQIPEKDLNELTKTYNASIEKIKLKGETLLNWLLSRGQTRKDYKAFLKNALQKDFGKRDSDPFSEFKSLN